MSHIVRRRLAEQRAESLRSVWLDVHGVPRVEKLQELQEQINELREIWVNLRLVMEPRIRLHQKQRKVAAARAKARKTRLTRPALPEYVQ